MVSRINSWDQSRKYLLLLIIGYLLLAIFYYAWTWSHELSDFGGDNAVYLLTAQHYSPWSSRSEIAEFFSSRSQFPPLYPFVLGLFDGGHNLLIAHILTTSFFLFFLLVFYHWQLSQGLSSIHAALVALLFALLPGTLTWSLSILSESTYMFLSCLVLLAVSKAETSADNKWYWTAAIFIAAACMTRTIGIALLAAFSLHLLTTRPPRWLFMIMAAAFPNMVWAMFAGQDDGNYLVSLIKHYQTSFYFALTLTIESTSAALRDGWVQNIAGSQSGKIPLLVIAAICLMGMVHRVYTRKLDGVYVAFYLLIILLWPHPPHAQRFIYVITPILIVQGWLFINHSLRLFPAIKTNKYLFALYYCSLLIVAMPVILHIFGRYTEPVPEEYVEFSHSAHWYIPDRKFALRNTMFRKSISGSMRELTKTVSADDCVYSIQPSIVSYYSGRLSKTVPRANVDDDAFFKALSESPCRYFYMMNFTSPGYTEEFYPFQRVAGSLRVISTVGLTPDARSPTIAILAERKSEIR